MLGAMRIGIEFHNLSTRVDASIRTGIQQVVAHILMAQHRIQSEASKQGVELRPLPMLPLAHKIPMPSHVNNSELVLREFAQENNLGLGELWHGSVSENGSNWSDEEFYERCDGLDWLLITGLCDFDHVVRRLRIKSPKLKVAVLVYDLGPIRRPELVASGMADWFKKRYLVGIRAHADLIFTISRHTGLDCLEYFREWPEFVGKLYSTPLPPEIPSISVVSESSAENFLDRLGVKRGRFFVAIGTIEPRKNLGSAILGFRRFCELDPAVTADMRFVVIGQRGWNNEDKKLLGLLGDLAHRVIFPGYLSRQQVELAMLTSAGLVMPSRLEGFGLPLALAYELGVPTVTCNNSSLPETTSVKSAFIPTEGYDQMALALWQLAARPDRPLIGDSTLHDVRRNLMNRWDQLVKDWLDCMRGLNGTTS